METQDGKDELPAASLTPPALADGQSTPDAAATTLVRTAAAGKEVAKYSHVATLDDLTKMESSIMANLERMIIKIMGGGSGSAPPEIPVPHVPAVETTLVDPSAVAPPPAGFVAATVVTMPVGAEQHSREH